MADQELQKPSFYHIPTLVAEQVNAHEAFVFAIIYWFTKLKEGRCFASNERISDALPYKSSAKSVQNALNTLEERGLITRHYKDEARRNRVEIVPLVDYTRHDVPPTDGTRTTHRLHDVPPTGDHINKRDKEKDKKTVYGELGKVLLTPNEYMTLVERLGEPATQGLIWELDTYIASTGKKYQSHYATILSWARRRVQERKQVKRKSI